MERYVHYTDLTRSRNTKNSSLLDYVLGYCRDISFFNRSCTISCLKPRSVGAHPIYDIERMCMPNSPLFQCHQVYDKPPFLKKKICEWPDFWKWNGPNFLTPMYMHIFFAQIPVKPLFSHLHKAGFLKMRVICNLVYKSQGIWKGI